MRLTPKIKELPVEGAEFRPKIVQPGPGAPRPAVDAASEPVIPRVGLDLYEAVYDAAAKNVSLRPRAEKLLPVLGSILIDAAALLAEADALFLEKVRDQHREARAAGVRQESVVADLEADLPLVQREVEKLDTLRSRAGQALSAALEAQKHLSPFASDAQIRNSEKRIAEAYAAQERAVTAHAEAAQDYRDRLLPQIAREKQKRDAIAQRVADLAAVIAGQPVNKLGMPVNDSRAWYAGEQSHGPHAA